MQSLETNLKLVKRTEATTSTGKVKVGYIQNGHTFYKVYPGKVKLNDNLVFMINSNIKLCFTVQSINNDDFVTVAPTNFKIVRSDVISKQDLMIEENTVKAIVAGKYIVHVRNCRYAQEEFNEIVKPNSKMSENVKKHFENYKRMQELDKINRKRIKDMYPDVYKKVYENN